MKVATMGPNNGVRTYKSLRAASRAISGKGNDIQRYHITKQVKNGGGFVNGVWVQPSIT